MIGMMLGAVMNMVRGGLWQERLAINGKILNAIVFAMFCALLAWLGNFSYPLLRGLAGGFLMFALQAGGYGVYCGAILNRCYMDAGQVVQTPKQENRWIDFLIWPLRVRPVLYGFAGATLRGAAWGAGLALPWMSFTIAPDTLLVDILSYGFLPLLGGATLGAAFLAATAVPNPSIQWKIGEALFGGFLWSSIAATAL